MPDKCKNAGCCQVIVAEDDAILKMVLAMQLKAAGIKFCAAGNGHHALALIKSHHPKVLLLDISMPGLSGFEVVDAIRQDPTLSDLNDMGLIVHTTLELTVEERERLSFGRTQFLTKTKVGNDLPEIVNADLAYQQRQAENAARRHS